MLAIAFLCFAPSLLVVLLGVVLTVDDVYQAMRRIRAAHRKARRDLERGRFQYDARAARRCRYPAPRGMSGGYR